MKKTPRKRGSEVASRRARRHKLRELGGKAARVVDDSNFAKPDCSDCEAWLLAYLHRAYPLPFGDVHRKIISSVVYAIDHGGNVVVAAPRGTGKSTLVSGVLLWALMTGRTAFPVFVPWDGVAKRRALKFWAGELCFNRRLSRDYADVVEPFVASRGVAQRLASMTQGGEATGARLALSEGLIVLPNGAGAIGSATINGNPRGLFYTTRSGNVVRPSFALIDDPQDRETAKSKKRISDTIERIDGDVAGMAGPDARLAMVMLCTVIERGDVAEHYLNHKNWRSIRVGQVATWPRDWEKKDSDTRKLWLEWDILRRDGERDSDSGKAAVAFYLANLDRMTDGMTVTWSERYDRKRGQPDALYSAMHDFFEMGEAAFFAERQNAPLSQVTTVYTLTPAIVQSRVDDGRKPGEIPAWALRVIALTDINPTYGLTWASMAFGRDQTSAVLGYGVHEMHVSHDATRAERDRAIFEHLTQHGKALAALPCAPKHGWGIDASGEAFEVVMRFAERSQALCGLQATPMTGRGARNYRPWGKSVVGQPREQCHMAAESRGRQWLVWHADYWREIAQRAWTGSVGAPGSCSLPDGQHRDFAEQICREQLRGKGDVGGQQVWVWDTQPGKHDAGDCMAMGYALAAWGGIGTAGRQEQKKPHGSRPRQRGVSVIYM